MLERNLRILAAAVLVVTGQTLSASTSFANGGTPLLLLADRESAGTGELERALTLAGYEITRVLPEYSWDGAQPPAESFACVVHLNGSTWTHPLPVPAQHALVDFVKNGGGYVGSQWNGFEQVLGQQVEMKDLVLQIWPHPDNCIGCNMTWTRVPGSEGHPVLAGIPSSFSFFADAHDAGPLVHFAEDPSTVLMTSPGGGAAVIVRELGLGRVVSFSSAANNATDLTLQDFNILTLYVNAADWACQRPAPEPPDCNAPETITPPDAPLSLTATSPQGFPVVVTDNHCFTVNPAGKTVDKTSSCVVDVEGDTLVIRDAGGVGNRITWTAVAVDDRGETSPEASCALEVVRPGRRR